MMQDVQTIPPFESFYCEHADPVLGYLRRLVGQQAEDVWQETFLKALRGYDRLSHREHLRAWVFTIATRTAMDAHRGSSRDAAARADIDVALLEVPGHDGFDQTAFEEIAHLTHDLPPKERAAVVLRYGYDLHYAEIADALGSSEEAARAAASSGVRRIRRSHERDA